MSDVVTCPHCGIEIVDEVAVCPRCNAVINGDQEGEIQAHKVPSLDENSGRLQEE